MPEPSVRDAARALLRALAAAGHGSVGPEVRATARALLTDGLDEDAPERAASLLRLGDLLLEEARPQDAELCGTWALRILVGGGQERDRRVARAVRLLAEVARRLGDRPRALDLLAKAKEILDELGAVGDVARVQNDQALVLREDGRLTEAEAVLRRALERLDSDERPVAAPEAATAWSNYGGLLSELGKTEKATAAYLRALELLEGDGHDEPERRAQVLNNLGAHLEGAGRPGDARPFLEEALALRRSHLPESHPHLASTLMNLALVERELGERGSALLHGKEAFQIAELVFGPAHKECDRYRSAYADLLDWAGRKPEAERLRHAGRFNVQ